MDAFSQKRFSGDEFEAVLAIFCCYEYGANASDTVEKITSD